MASASTSASSYDDLHRQCRTLESLFDTKLTAYARLASAAASSRAEPDLEAGESTERWKDLEIEVEELLEKLEETNERLTALTSNSSANPPSQSMLRAVQRHHDVVADYAREFRRTKAGVQAARDRENLLSGVRNDIDAYKSNAADSLLAERGRIDSSHRMTDDILEQAYETRSEFARQRSSLAGINTRMQGVLNQMPGMNKLVSMIKSRRRRDTVIVAVLIGVCTLFILSWMSR